MYFVHVYNNFFKQVKIYPKSGFCNVSKEVKFLRNYTT